MTILVHRNPCCCQAILPDPNENILPMTVYTVLGNTSQMWCFVYRIKISKQINPEQFYFDFLLQPIKF